MTKCKTKRWSLMSTDLKTLCEEIQVFLDGEEVKAVQTFTWNGQLVLVAVFEK